MLSVAQSVGNITQTVNKRNTIGTLTASPSGSITAGATVTFTYVLNTAGAPAPASETVQFMDGAASLGTPQTITTTSASNLIPYSQVNTAQGWSKTGTAATVTPLAVNGPDASTSTATTLSFPDGTSNVLYAVPSSTNYANQQVTFSIWAESASATNLTLTVQDNPFVAATDSAACAVNSTWHRCSVTYTFPAGSGTGFSVSLSSTSFATPINVWGAQFEEAAQPGPYVSTIGTARPSGAQAGTLTMAWSEFESGTHSVTVQYIGDTNFAGSTSNAVVLTAGAEVPGMTLTDSPAGSSAYGVAVTLTVELWDQSDSNGWVPSGTVQFFDGGTSLGTATVDGTGKATITFSGLSSLAAGSHTLTAQYSGDSTFAASTSSAVTHLVTKANSSTAVTTAVTSSRNPSVYGDSVKFSINVSSSVGVQPTGTVSVVDQTTSTNLGTLPLDGSGNANVTSSAFTAGAHSVVVTYSGDSNYD
jgi:hypothetical protein